MDVAYVLSFIASFLQAVFTPTLVIYAYNLSLTELQIGFITGFASLIYIVGALLSAILYRKLGAAKTILLSFCLIAAGLWAHTLAADFTSLLLPASTVLLGFGVFWPAVESSLSTKGSSVSLFSFSWSSGSLAGALITSSLLRIDLKLLFVFYSLVAFSGSVLSPRMKHQVKTSRGMAMQPNNSLKRLLLLLTPWFYCLAYSASSSGVFTFYPIFIESHSLSKDYISLVNFSMLFTRTLTFFFFEKLPAFSKNILLASLLFGAGITLTRTSDPFLTFLIASVIGFSQGIVYATALEQVFNRGQGVERATSLFESFIGLGYAVAPPLSSLANALLGVEPISFSSIMSIFLVLPVTFFNTKRRRKDAWSKEGLGFPIGKNNNP
ncbi:MAG: MFS transporter [Infirmifilum sp.]